MHIVLLIVSIFAATANNLLLHGVSLKEKENLFFYNFLCGAVWFGILLALCRGNFAFTANEVRFGVCYGLTQAAFLLCKSGAMSTGPVSVTTLIGNCSLLLSTAAGVLIWREPVGALQVIGIVLLCVAVVLCTYRTQNGAHGRKCWALFCVGFFISAAGVGILFKAFHKAGGGDCNRMMLCGAMVLTVCMLICTLATHAFTRQTLLTKPHALWLILLCGVVSCLYNRLNIPLAGELPSVLFYPVFNGGVILLCTLCGMWIFREKTTWRGKCGILLGMLAIGIIGLR